MKFHSRSSETNTKDQASANCSASTEITQLHSLSPHSESKNLIKKGPPAQRRLQTIAAQNQAKSSILQKAPNLKRAIGGSDVDAGSERIAGELRRKRVAEERESQKKGSKGPSIDSAGRSVEEALEESRKSRAIKLKELPPRGTIPNFG